MNRPGKLTTIVASAVTVAALGGGIATAATHLQGAPAKSSHHTAPAQSNDHAAPAKSSHVAATTKPHAPSTEPTTPDTDNIQQGDQTTPDTPAGSAQQNSSEPTTPDTDNIQQGDQSGSDNGATSSSSANGSENQSESESGTADDGPGGHQDPPGDVQHEGGANEQ